MRDDSTKKMPDGVIPLDIGCFRRKTAKELEEEADPKNLEARIRRILENGHPKPPTQRGQGGLR